MSVHWTDKFLTDIDKRQWRLMAAHLHGARRTAPALRFKPAPEVPADFDADADRREELADLSQLDLVLRSRCPL